MIHRPAPKTLQSLHHPYHPQMTFAFSHSTIVPSSEAVPTPADNLSAWPRHTPIATCLALQVELFYPQSSCHHRDVYPPNVQSHEVQSNSTPYQSTCRYSYSYYHPHPFVVHVDPTWNNSSYYYPEQAQSCHAYVAKREIGRTPHVWQWPMRHCTIVVELVCGWLQVFAVWRVSSIVRFERMILPPLPTMTIGCFYYPLFVG
mmetsp:Transcript_11837/g.20827  ORF Transcript_11837/g.20827 Transcript_11837/m.20827 type:complete len:202 (-) Transcript_11837:374-979(-)